MLQLGMQWCRLIDTWYRLHTHTSKTNFRTDFLETQRVGGGARVAHTTETRGGTARGLFAPNSLEGGLDIISKVWIISESSFDILYRNQVSMYRNMEVSMRTSKNRTCFCPPIFWHPRVFYAGTEPKLQWSVHIKYRNRNRTYRLVFVVSRYRIELHIVRYPTLCTILAIR